MKFVKRIRDTLGWSRSDLARAIGCHSNYISRYEKSNGKNARIDYILRMRLVSGMSEKTFVKMLEREFL